MKRLLGLMMTLWIGIPGLMAQCNLNNYTTATLISPAMFPYTNAQSVTVSATAPGVPTLQNFNYTCGPNTFTTSTPAWWLNAANQVITLTFSQPVCEFTVIVNGTNTGEEFYFNSNNGPCSLTNYCTTNFTLTGGGSSLLCNGFAGGATGTIITCNNAVGATQYLLTHNGTGSGSRITLLDCYIGCAPPPNNTINCTMPNLAYCAGATFNLPYTCTGTFNAGNIFTAQLSNAAGSFAAPVNIGTLASTTNGIIACTIPPGTPSGAGYRVRVSSNNPFLNGTDNGQNITINALPNVVATANPTSVCAGGSLTLTGSGATSYTWTNGVTNGQSFVPNATATYTVTGSDANGCSKTSTVTVPVNPLPIVNANAAPGTSICANTQLTLSGTGAVNYTWTPTGTNNVPFTPLTTTTYTVTGTDANNCSATSSVTVTVNPLPIIGLLVSPNDTVCAGTAVTLTANGANTYNWTGGIQNGVPFIPLVSGAYTITATTAANCSATATQSVVVEPQPSVNLGPDVEFCAGDSIVLNATTPGATYLWQNATTAPTLTAKTTGLYWVRVAIGNCIDRDTVLVNVKPYPPLNLGLDTAICQGDQHTIDVTVPGGSYLWQDNSTSPVYTIDEKGTYFVTVTQNGCSKKDSIFVDILTRPIVSLGNDTSICKGDEIKVDAFWPGASYQWQDNSIFSNYTIRDTGYYWVRVKLGLCVGYDEKYVGPSNQCECPVFVPNAFTPNEDGRNDEFRLVNTKNIQLITFNVYNRWGEMIFSTPNPELGWDGRVKGMEAEMGTYFYFAKYRCDYTGKEFTVQGDVTLIR